jgi:DME family drug/metabolite transporter
VPYNAAVLSGLLLIALAAVSWGTTGSVSTVLVAGAAAEPLLIGTARMVVASALLLVGARLLAGTAAIARADIGRCLLMGACMAGYQAAYFTAVTMTGIAVTALIAICSAPIIIAMLAAVLLGERLRARGLLALGLGVGGTALLVAGPSQGLAPEARSLSGAALALTAGVTYALYVVVAKRSLADSAPLPLTALTFTAAALLLLPSLGWTRAPLAQVTRGWPWLLYLGAVATAGAYALYAVGLRRVPASVAGIVTLLEPLTATLLGVLIFGERLGAAGALGAFLLVGALALLCSAPSLDPPSAATPSDPSPHRPVVPAKPALEPRPHGRRRGVRTWLSRGRAGSGD